MTGWRKKQIKLKEELAMEMLSALFIIVILGLILRST
jgi:hypothetical protein